MSTAFLSRIMKDRTDLQLQFPLITPMNNPPTIYEGFCRCETGPVKDYADKGIWPFTEYVQMHRFRLELPDQYPTKPPVATWLTNISHPNIVPLTRGVVCVSTLDKRWRPDLTLSLVVESIFFLLGNPNPLNPWKYASCLSAGQAIMPYGDIKKQKDMDGQPVDVFFLRPSREKPSDIVRFRIIPRELPSETRPAGPPNDRIHFHLPKRSAEGRKR